MFCHKDTAMSGFRLTKLQGTLINWMTMCPDPKISVQMWFCVEWFFQVVLDSSTCLDGRKCTEWVLLPKVRWLVQSELTENTVRQYTWFGGFVNQFWFWTWILPSTHGTQPKSTCSFLTLFLADSPLYAHMMLYWSRSLMTFSFKSEVFLLYQLLPQYYLFFIMFIIIHLKTIYSVLHLQVQKASPRCTDHKIQ